MTPAIQEILDTLAPRVFPNKWGAGYQAEAALINLNAILSTLRRHHIDVPKISQCNVCENYSRSGAACKVCDHWEATRRKIREKALP